ncbi:MBL fold metallo-hydrolase [Ktedonosporobacter rubrisoli]|uniref:MBL fold metallo-hydrolase n=1 Tax=Ktedonosporobacter rubrisoli TaxID=2509675 RepID=A0A4P6JY18_KTERU|nr:MBL fold metallo-hydrolase [Ktedonosporobacter rubrisoli]QBD80385.1 MBL fold metallo-hydrolase [Ktedonosporobacter rubrisoli]
MYFQQITRQDIGCATYLVGSNQTGEAAVIDPRIDLVKELLALLEREGLHLKYIVETHNHADHVSGHHQLAQRTGATIAVHALAGVAYPHLALQHNDELTLGEVHLRIIHTPGHRPEHIAVAVIDSSRGADPWLVLTGDSLFIGDVARPDLAVAGKEGARELYRSLHEQLLALPDGTMVYPGHLAGSLCGRVNNRMTGTSIGFERHLNPALAIASPEEFVQYMNENLPQRPPNLDRIVALNKAASIPPIAPLDALSAQEISQRQAQGAQVLDVRSVQQFAAGHVPGALSIPLDAGQFQNRAGHLISAETPLLLVASSQEEAHRAQAALAVIGYTNVAGMLSGGIEAWQQAGYEAQSLPSITVQQLQEKKMGEPELQIVDVRDPDEWEAGHIEGAVHIPLFTLPQKLNSLDAKRPTALICGSGLRSTIASSLLQSKNWSQLYNTEGGMSAWNSAQLPTHTDEKVSRA